MRQFLKAIDLQTLRSDMFTLVNCENFNKFSDPMEMISSSIPNSRDEKLKWPEDV